MARNLWRPTRFGLPGPVVGILAVVVVLLIVVILWVRKGCQASPEPEQGTTVITETRIPPERVPEETPESIRSPKAGPEPKAVEERKPDIYEKYWQAGQKAFDEGEYINARYQLSRALKGTKDPSTRKNIQLQLATIAKELTFSRQVKPDDLTVELYHVKSGDYPAAVAKKFNITDRLFMKINGISNARLMRADKSYKVIKGPFDVVIDKKTFRLDVFLGDYYIQSYSIGLGRDNSTPPGTFLAGAKLTEPGWWGVLDEKSGRRVYVPHGHRENPLGDHWISLRPLPQADGKQAKDSDYGIHGTNQPETIGKQASHGCIRMRNKEVAEVFDLLVTGKSRITIMAH